MQRCGEILYYRNYKLVEILELLMRNCEICSHMNYLLWPYHYKISFNTPVYGHLLTTSWNHV